MKDTDNNHAELFRLIAWRSPVTTGGRSLACSVTLSLAIIALLASSACGPSLPATTTATPIAYTRVPTPKPTDTTVSTVTLSLPPTPTLLPPVTLEEPENGLCLPCEKEVTFCWNCPYKNKLPDDEYYRLSIRGKGQDSSVFYHKEDSFSLPAPSPGEHEWAVAVVRATGQDQYELVSKESDWYSFEIAPPSPVVRAISPMSTVQGTSVPVVISGENFTHSLAITIGVPLQATFVNSSTITAMIPATLEAGEYPVIVKDLTSGGASFASFTVTWPSSPPEVTPGPTLSAYSSPELTRVEIFGCSVTFYWTWIGELAEDEYFAVRADIGTPRESRCWTKEFQYPCTLEEEGDYVWEVAICRGVPETKVCELLAVSDRATFYFPGCFTDR